MSVLNAKAMDALDELADQIEIRIGALGIIASEHALDGDFDALAATAEEGKKCRAELDLLREITSGDLFERMEKDSAEMEPYVREFEQRRAMGTDRPVTDAAANEEEPYPLAIGRPAKVLRPTTPPPAKN